MFRVNGSGLEADGMPVAQKDAVQWLSILKKSQQGVPTACQKVCWSVVVKIKKITTRGAHLLPRLKKVTARGAHCLPKSDCLLGTGSEIEKYSIRALLP